MSLKSFLNPTYTELTKEIEVSKRFKNDDGSIAKFKIKSIPQSENERLIKECTKRYKSKGEWIEELDKIAYQKKIILTCTIEPDFADSELCKLHGVLNPLDVPGRMLLTGEYAKLANAIMDINEFGPDEETLMDEAKN